MLGVAQLINEAWSYEFNNDQEVALRLYKTAFNNLLDINNQVSSSSSSVNNSSIPGISPFEIRSVADYINHQTCQKQFSLLHPRDAITQFKKYIDTFKQHTKAPEYAFEHAAWLSQQYLMFADLFHQAVIGGVKASKAQHPGYYYYEAAMQMIDRRQNITEYTNDNIRSNQMPVTNELLSMITTSNFASFLRQCGWICIDPNAGPPVAPISLAPLKISDSETNSEPVNYSVSIKLVLTTFCSLSLFFSLTQYSSIKQEIIIRALYKAIEYFEEWNRPRMHNHISVMIADEYFQNKDLRKAQTLYTRSLTMYEKEGWSLLADSIKEKLSVIEKDTRQP